MTKLINPAGIKGVKNAKTELNRRAKYNVPHVLVHAHLVLTGNELSVVYGEVPEGMSCVIDDVNEQYTMQEMITQATFVYDKSNGTKHYAEIKAQQ